MSKIEGRWAGEALSLLRIVAALIFLMHGSSKLIGFPSSEMPMPPAGSLLWVGGILELVGGLLLLIGLLSRPVAFILSGEMAVAYWMFHAPQSTFPLQNGGDAAILYCFVFLLIAAAGPGPWSIDAAISRKRHAPVIEDRDTGEPMPEG
jgi:putative oxidoreductase